MPAPLPHSGKGHQMPVRRAGLRRVAAGAIFHARGLITAKPRLKGRSDSGRTALFMSAMPETPALHVLNGPNLNLLGEREPDIYGRETLADIQAVCEAAAGDVPVVFRQSNHEGVLVDWIHEARGTTAGIVINPGAYSHTSVAILDALNAYEAPVIEVHISNIHKREAFRHHSFVSTRAEAVIAGCGPHGYELALRHLAVIAGA